VLRGSFQHRGVLMLVCLAVGWQGVGWPAPAQAQTQTSDRLPAARARLSDTAELEQVVELYMAGQYERCVSELSVFLDAKGPSPFRDAGAIERGRLYFASCSLLVGNREQARTALHSALEANPLMSAPDSLTFPPPVVSLFLEVRDEVEALIAKREQEQLSELRRQAQEAAAAERKQAEQEALLYRLAGEETIVVKQSRAIAMLPLGAGQFQNGDVNLGIFFAVSEVVLGATLITAAAVHAEAYTTAVFYVDSNQTVPNSVRQTYDAMGTLAVASTFALLGVTALGIVEANLKFKPERLLGVRKRPLPDGLQLPSSIQEPRSHAPRFLPIAALSDQGALFGLRGSF